MGMLVHPSKPSHTHYVAIHVWHRVLKHKVPGPSRQRQDGDPEGDRGDDAGAQEGDYREQPGSGETTTCLLTPGKV
jgi:hypothetical protein